MKKIIVIILIVAGNSVLAQDIFQEKFYTPELVLKYREEAGLSAEQVESIKNIYNSEIPAYNIKKWDLDAEMAKLEKLISESKIDSRAATAQLEKVMALEAEIKKMKLSMLVRTKNTLTLEQQEKLTSYKSEVVSVSSFRNSSNTNQNGSLLFSPKKMYDQKKPLLHIIEAEGKVTEERMLTEFPKDIKPEDIDALQVLRADAAKAKYGERGENGAVIITLKKK